MIPATKRWAAIVLAALCVLQPLPIAHAIPPHQVWIAIPPPSVGGPFSGAVSTTNLVEWWPMSEASGTRVGVHAGLNLTDNNTVTSNSGVGSTTAAEFASANTEYLSRADEAATSMADIDFTLVGWFYFTSLISNETMVSKASSNSAAATEFRLAYNGSTLMVFWSVSDGSTLTSVSATLPSPPSTGTWYFVAAWHDSTANTISIQINNGTIYSTSHTTGCWDSSAPLEFGRWGAGRYFNGRGQRYGLFKRLLSVGDRTAFFNSGNGRDY
jgi:hypothetical protein